MATFVAPIWDGRIATFHVDPMLRLLSDMGGLWALVQKSNGHLENQIIDFPSISEAATNIGLFCSVFFPVAAAFSAAPQTMERCLS